VVSMTFNPEINNHSAGGIRHRSAAELLMLVTTFCWASNIVAGKVALEGFNALALAQVRMVLAAIFYAAFSFCGKDARASTSLGSNGCSWGSQASQGSLLTRSVFWAVLPEHLSSTQA
jgi:drug/metabolite transporter (DMT)-like permease